MGTIQYAFTVSLSAASGQSVTVAYGTADGTATVADSDYATAGGVLTFAPGETKKLVTVLVNGDTSNEADEDFTLNLSDLINATLGVSSVSGLIQNDDPTFVRSRQVFYNDSVFDGYDPTASPADVLAIATDKSALLPGLAATFGNYTSYSRGLNGIMIEIVGLTGTLSSDDFEFPSGK